jgi:parallel beta-helix repeat protein
LLLTRKCVLRLCLISLAALMTSPALFAATRCVSQSGKAGCFTTISAAVAAAAPGDTIQVAEGIYKEDVTIPKPLALVGRNKENTIVDAAGLGNGFNIDGQNHAGLSHVVITGFTVENANFSGILVTNTSAVTLSSNFVRNNDRNLSGGACPGLPSQFLPADDLDCGEGIHLSGVDHSTIMNNVVEHNAGGILVTDDTGAIHDNVISGNVVRNNVPDCGITLPSHSGAGVFQNTVSGNVVAENGGAGVGIFAPGPGTKTYANVIVNNQLTGNGQPGVTMHNHAAPGVGGVPSAAPPVMFSDNVIIGNRISRNHQDTADAATSGPTGINLFSLTPMPGTIIVDNFIFQEALDVAINVPAASGATDIQVHLNDLLKPVGLQNNGTASVDATENWWGCPAGPNRPGCSSITGSGAVVFQPWLTRPNNGNQHEGDRHED